MSDRHNIPDDEAETRSRKMLAEREHPRGEAEPVLPVLLVGSLAATILAVGLFLALRWGSSKLGGDGSPPPARQPGEAESHMEPPHHFHGAGGTLDR